jgi:hypothetical protein
MARVLHLVIAACAVSTVVRADTPPLADARAAITERGIQLKAGKRHVIIIVPPAEVPTGAPTESTLGRGAEVYFGDGKTLYRQPLMSYENKKQEEWIGLLDPRGIHVATLKRVGSTYTLACALSGTSAPSRIIELGEPQPTKLAKKTVIHEQLPGFEPYLLARAPVGTTYYYLDRPRTDAHDSEEFRLFIGKRGALKRVPIKEVARDTASDVFVTAKGTLIIANAKEKDVLPTVTFGPTAKKQTALTPVPAYPNRTLIYGDLGVYARDPSGLPCEEL